MRIFYKGETVTLWLETRNNNGALFNPASGCSCTITDPGGTNQVNGAAMTNTATGVYVYRYTPSTSMLSGVWIASITATDTSSTGKEKVNFILKD